MSPVDALAQQVATRTRRGDACIVVIFGAAGDLTRRKLFPAIYNLLRRDLLSNNFAILGVDRQEATAESFRNKIAAEIKQFATVKTEPNMWNWIAERIHYLPGDFTAPASYSALAGLLPKIDEQYGTQGNIMFYLATPPRFFSEIARQLGTAGLTRQDGNAWRRIVIEKPFGRDLASAAALNQELKSVLNETQIFRIDHYLGKETVQNIIVFRFANGIFEPVWNNTWIDNVQITVAESVGVEGRGNYYDRAGALRDMIQNHMFQLLALTAMEPPAHFHADAIRDRKKEVHLSIRPFTRQDVLENVVRGQYAAGTVAGRSVAAYRAEPSVAPDSVTETFVALKMFIDNQRWSGVPFYLRTGKALPARVSEIAIQFKHSPYAVLPEEYCANARPSSLVLRIQPDEGIFLHFAAKEPGVLPRLDMVGMDFYYSRYFGKEATSGYETLLYDCMIGDPMLFTRADNLENCWGIVEPVICTWEELKGERLYPYPAGTWGPEEADELIRRDGRQWRRLTE